MKHITKAVYRDGLNNEIIIKICYSIEEKLKYKSWSLLKK